MYRSRRVCSVARTRHRPVPRMPTRRAARESGRERSRGFSLGLVDRLAARLLGVSATGKLTASSNRGADDHLLPAFKSYLQGEVSCAPGNSSGQPRLTGVIGRIRRSRSRTITPRSRGSGHRYPAKTLPPVRCPLRATVRAGSRAVGGVRRWRAGDAVEADRAYRALLARYPDDIDAWFRFGEIRFHHWPLLGLSHSPSEESAQSPVLRAPEPLRADPSRSDRRCRWALCGGRFPARTLRSRRVAHGQTARGDRDALRDGA